jgi:hypothetical protein
VIYDWTEQPLPPRGRLYDLDSGEEITELVFYINTDCPYSHEYSFYVKGKDGLYTRGSDERVPSKTVKGARVKFVPNQENPL